MQQKYRPFSSVWTALKVPGWRLHALTGDLRGHYSVKVSANWRITFRLENGNAEIVDYQDYH